LGDVTPEQIPRFIYADDVGVCFGGFFARICNCSPASAAVYSETAGDLMDHKTFEEIGSGGARRSRVGQKIKLSDQIVPSREKSLSI